MKITKIHLKNWHQFEDLELDFTYPKGHEKEGQPLKKVCFIGPNGVGKTKLLNLIANFGKGDFIIPRDGLLDLNCTFNERESKEFKSFTFKSDQLNEISFSFYNYYKSDYIGNKVKYDFLFQLFELPNALGIDSKILFTDQLADFKGEVKSLGTSVNVDLPQYVIQTSKLEVNSKVGKLGYGMIVDRKIANIATSENGKIVEMLEKNPEKTRDEIFSQFGEFKRIKEIFGEVTDNLITLDKYDSDTTDLVFKTKNGEEVNRFDLSSGVEQIFYRLLFVASFNLKESIILVDEPEVSLFPDKQKKIVGWYTDYCDLGNSNQFFFATHSPLVAGQFEACEIFKLDFNDQGKVFCVKPDSEVKYLDIEGVSTVLFPSSEPNKPVTTYGDEEVEKIKELINLIKQAKKENNTQELESLWSRYSDLADKLQIYSFYPDLTLENNEIFN